MSAAAGHGTAASSAGPDGPVASNTVTSGAAPSSTRPQATMPLVSLVSMFGGELEGGAACAADGTCD